MHILPAAGSATRFGGIPKYLLPVQSDGKCLLVKHIEASLECDDLKIIVMTHPTMREFVSELLSKFTSNVIVDSILSQTMTETIIEATKRYSSQDENVSFMLPDTLTSTIHLSGMQKYVKALQEKTNQVLLFPFLESYRGKFGQVSLSPHNETIDRIQDKDIACNFEYIWGGMSLKRELLINLDPKQPTIGNCIQELINKKVEFSPIIFSDEYFDCGNMSDYMRFLFSKN